MKIPKIFHHIWVGPNKIPQEFLEYQQGWKKFHPGWKDMIWNDSNIPPLINQELFDNAQTYSEKADILRYELIYAYGGIYVDYDYECLKNLEPLLKELTLVLCKEADYLQPGIPQFFNNSLIGCTPEHPLVKKIIDNLPDRYEAYNNLPLEEKARTYTNWRSGPFYLTDVLNDEYVLAHQRDI
jgi:mannosyltransferase OCH1-like enzyme